MEDYWAIPPESMGIGNRKLRFPDYTLSTYTKNIIISSAKNPSWAGEFQGTAQANLRLINYALAMQIKIADVFSSKSLGKAVQDSVLSLDNAVMERRPELIDERTENFLNVVAQRHGVKNFRANPFDYRLTILRDPSVRSHYWQKFCDEEQLSHRYRLNLYAVTEFARVSSDLPFSTIYKQCFDDYLSRNPDSGLKYGKAKVPIFNRILESGYFKKFTEYLQRKNAENISSRFH